MHSMLQIIEKTENLNFSSNFSVYLKALKPANFQKHQASKLSKHFHLIEHIKCQFSSKVTPRDHKKMLLYKIFF